MNLLRNAGLSLEILWAHKLRTLLSMSGIAIGVGAVIVMVAVGKGAEEEILGRIRMMGTDLIVVNAARARIVAGRGRQGELATDLRSGDADAVVRECPAVLRAAPAAARAMSVRHESRTIGTTVSGMSPVGLKIRNLPLRSGRFFDEEDERAKRRVAVLGPTVVSALFGTDDPVGRTLLVGRIPFEIVGVTRRRGVDASGADQDDVVFVPLETALRRVWNLPYVTTIYIQAKTAVDLGRAEREVRAFLEERARPSGRAPSFTVQNQANLLRVRRDAARSLTLLVAGVAAVSLGAGGIGILAVMILAVRERRREIGIRRAVGARRRDILLQFLIEAAGLAVAGGALGTLAGVVVAGLLSAAALSWPAIAVPGFSSLLIGLAAGTYPAVRAARVDPIRSLR